MRLILILVVGAALAWSGYWFVGKTGVETATQAWLQDRRAEGWQAEAADVTTSGFPYRFDTTLTDLALADPNTGWAWRTPKFQFLALTYQPNHLIAIWPKVQNVATPFEDITVTSQKMRASAVLSPDTSLALQSSNFSAEAMGLASNANWGAQAEFVYLAAEQREAAPKTYRLGFSAHEVVPSTQLKGWLDPTGALPASIRHMRIDADVTFDAPWDRAALENRRPQITKAVFRDFRANWGELELGIGGSFTVDTVGTPEGKLTVRAENWLEILDMAQDTGLLPEGLRPAAERLLSGFTSNQNTLDVPLTLSGGRIYLGPVPIGVTPDLTLR